MPEMGGGREECSGTIGDDLAHAQVGGECASDEALARAMEEQEWYEAQQHHRFFLVMCCVCMRACAHAHTHTFYTF